jgi:cytidyltransferase-like protein
MPASTKKSNFNQRNSKLFSGGLICGRFYPYHLGHRYLIETALQQSEKVYLIVCQRKEQTIKAIQRVDWIKESFPEQYRNKQLQLFILDQDQQELPDRDSQQWAQAALQTTDCRQEDIEAVFTSERYQQSFADLLSSKLVLVDPQRNFRSISGSTIRNQQPGYQEYLEDHVLKDIQNLNLADDQEQRSLKFNYSV